MTVAVLRVVAVLVIAVTVWARPADAAPQLQHVVTRGRVSMYAERGLESTAHQLARGAETALDRIAADLVDLPVPRAIEVRLVRDAARLPAVAPAGRGAPPWAIGVAYPDLGVISVALRRDGRPVDPTATLKHELGHIALGVALGRRAPHWLHEGFAYQHAGEWSWERTETLAGMAWLGSIVPLEDLDRTFPQEELPAHRAYAQSYDFVGYLSRRGRWEDVHDDGDRWPFRRFLTMIGQTGDLDVAAKIAFGRPLRELYEEWQQDLTRRYLLAPIGLLGLAMWIFAALLLTIAFLRRRRQNKRRLAEWDEEDRQRQAAERAREAELAARYGWGEPIGGEAADAPDDDDDDAPRPRGPRWIN